MQGQLGCSQRCEQIFEGGYCTGCMDGLVAVNSFEVNFGNGFFRNCSVRCGAWTQGGRQGVQVCICRQGDFTQEVSEEGGVERS